MTCEDLLKMKPLEDGLVLVSGKNGLDRSIRWLYFADCMECLEDGFNPAEWIHGGELIVVTNENLTNDEAKLMAIMRGTNEKNVAGFIINIGQISPAVIQLADELSIPLFEINWSLRIVDLSQILCKALIEEENHSHSLDRILATLLYAENVSETDLIYQSQYYGVDLRKKHRIIIFDINQFGDYIKRHKITDEGKISDIKDFLVKTIKREFRTNGLTHTMTLLQSDCAITLIPTNAYDDTQLITIIKSINYKFHSSFELTLTAGIGNSYDYIDELRLSFQEAKKSIDIAHIQSEDISIMFYKDSGVYSLLMQIENEKTLDNYYTRLLHPLTETDNLHDGNLSATLETYFKCNCNANAAADALFIHRNTMRYRLEKIKTILDKDLNDVTVCMELNLAFHVKKFREKQINKSH